MLHPTAPDSTALSWVQMWVCLSNSSADRCTLFRNIHHIFNPVYPWALQFHWQDFTPQGCLLPGKDIQGSIIQNGAWIGSDLSAHQRENLLIYLTGICGRRDTRQWGKRWRQLSIC